MSKIKEFLMEQEVRGSESVEVNITGFPHPFVLRSITEDENEVVRRSCQKVTLDKKTRQKSSLSLLSCLPFYANRIRIPVPSWPALSMFHLCCYL